MKKKLLLLLSTSAVAVSAVAIAVGTSPKAKAFFAVSDEQWVHYAEALPGTVAGTTKGIREYWVQCGGGYSFEAPSGVTITEGTGHNTSGFTSDDPRWIYSFNEFHKPAIASAESSTLNVVSLGLPAKSYTSAKVLVGSTEITGTYADGKLTISTLPTGLSYGSHTVTIQASTATDTYVLRGEALLCTRVINTVDEFKYNCSGIFTGTGAEANKTFGAGEYYVLGNDLSGEAGTWTYKKSGATKAIWHSSFGDVNATDQGFLGTFDGNNYAIVGGDLGTTAGDNTFGMFGGLGKGSVVKNLNITKVKYAGTQYTSLLAKDMIGTTLDNIFVEVNSTSGTSQTGNFGVLNVGSASGTLINSTIVIRNSDGSTFGSAPYIIRTGTGAGFTCTQSAFCGSAQTTGVTGITNVNWELDNINTALTFVWKPAPDNMYRMLLHGGKTAYNRVVVNGKALSPSQYSLWYNAGGTPVLDIPSAYMNAGDVIYVTKTVNGNAARGVAPAKS